MDRKNLDAGEQRYGAVPTLGMELRLALKRTLLVSYRNAEVAGSMPSSSRGPHGTTSSGRRVHGLFEVIAGEINIGARMRGSWVSNGSSTGPGHGEDFVSAGA